jgi:hypothetical protein
MSIFDLFGRRLNNTRNMQNEAMYFLVPKHHHFVWPGKLFFNSIFLHFIYVSVFFFFFLILFFFAFSFLKTGMYPGYKVPLVDVPYSIPGSFISLVIEYYFFFVEFFIGKVLEMETLSLSPRLFLIRNFLTDEEAGRFFFVLLSSCSVYSFFYLFNVP